MDDSDYATSLDSLMVSQQQMSQQHMSQQQMSQQQIPQEQIEYPHQMEQHQVQPVPKVLSPPSNNLKLMEKLANVNYPETLQSIIIIAVLFILFSNCYFKNFCKTLPFLCITDGEFNMQSLIILGIAVGVCYMFIKMYII